MPDLEKFVKNVMYGGIGAAASLVEKGGDLARSLVEKGQETVRNSQDTADDIKRRLQEFCDGLMKRGEIDISKLTPKRTSPNCRMMPFRLAANRTTTHNKPQTALSVNRQGGLSL